ncbi:hypothetical protein SAMN05216488_2304 [Microbacterium sp. LKL04]|uniref:hypothetical protein n=1 Tax=Microbacterium sp. LKL04 TaxID=912630 RepID=UPI000875D9E8|nr:hypothetical protein [Microbacterium sp. LKL04]SCY56142.1 hypothetical protein SAMN05216488_2304 [Microbacterium sp. LKL04]
MTTNLNPNELPTSRLDGDPRHSRWTVPALILMAPQAAALFSDTMRQVQTMLSDLEAGTTSLVDSVETAARIVELIAGLFGA